MTHKNTFITVSLICLIGFGIWTALFSLRSQILSSHLMASLPDGLMEGVNAIIMDKEGKPKLKILTPRMVHYSEQDTTQLVNPRLTIYRQSPQPWYITAKQAKAKQGIDHVDFWQDVVIHHPADDKQPDTLIKTEKLTVHTTNDTAETADFITLTQPNLTIKATGMFADMTKGHIKLFSSVRGEYVPN